jgi:argininosuccinate lyase
MSTTPPARPLWHGRFEGGPAADLLAFTVSLPFDSRLWPQDLRGSRAHVRGLERAGLLDADGTAAVLAPHDEVAE